MHYRIKLGPRLANHNSVHQAWSNTGKKIKTFLARPYEIRGKNITRLRWSDGVNKGAEKLVSSY